MRIDKINSRGVHKLGAILGLFCHRSYYTVIELSLGDHNGRGKPYLGKCNFELKYTIYGLDEGGMPRKVVSGSRSLSKFDYFLLHLVQWWCKK